MIIDFRLPSPGEKLEPRQSFVLWHVGWSEYEKIVEALNEQHVRVTYCRGDLELMSPLPLHELMKVWFRHFMLTMADELDVAYFGMGQTTLRRRDRKCGFDPDDCYYFESRRKIVDWKTLNLDRDPPPDLVFELDLTRTSVNRLDVCAALAVPEVWRFDGENWHIHLLGADGSYRISSASAVLPYLPIAEIVPLLRQSLYTRDDRERLHMLKHWVREHVVPFHQAWGPSTANP